MAKKEIKQSYSSFSRDAKVNRAKQVRRDNDIVKTPKCTIEDVDWAIMSYIRDVIQPQIIENDQLIDVPVMYANGEKWAQVQAKGFMRDRKGKIMRQWRKKYFVLESAIPSGGSVGIQCTPPQYSVFFSDFLLFR